MNTRKTTCKLLELVDEGAIDATTALNAALMYMSEDDVADMCRIYGFLISEEDLLDE